MDFIGMLILSVIQGITEWLPVSSSGHLALAQHYFFGELPVIYDMGMHVGTMLAVLLYFREKILGMLLSLLKFDTKSKDFRLVLLIILGSVPTAIIGFGFKGFFVSMYTQPMLVGAALVATALILFSTKFSFSKNKEPEEKSAVAMGIGQGLAVAPGISRSGATISAGLQMGMGWKEAASFSFLLAVPAIFGATFFLLLETPAESIDWGLMAVGATGAFVSGYASIHILLNFISRKTFPLFGVYCLLLGLAVIALNYTG
ncbi:UDP-diphosphatase [Candidatus Micrarchaeota archaeon]|nr:UDP-diphosphatase [Candidatus Micrarchaeota archaeon]MBD3417578.1 UDP-diphosphatase [Candidatus Micrarchaeota archaeon]